MDFTVIIPNYNGLRFMEKCMDALKRQTYSSFCVLIVDNGSTDGSEDYIRDIAENGCGGLKVKAIMLPENTGFSGAVNAGIAAADTRYVILLNNDTEAEPDYIKEIADDFRADTAGRIFAVTPKMVQLMRPELLDDAGDGYCLLGWAFQRGVGQPAAAKAFERKTKVFSACAGAAAYRKDVLEEIRLKGADTGESAYFDPLHFAYLEDVDVSFRARIHGYDIIYEPKAVVRHVGSGTSGSKYNPFKVRLAARNNVYLNYKNMPPLMLVINLPGILLGVFIKWLFFMRLGFAGDYAGGFKEALGTLYKCRETRTRFKPGRFPVYVKLELMMLSDTFSYVRDFVRRRLSKHGGR